MKKKYKIALGAVAALSISTTILLKLPGNVPPPTEEGVKLPAFPKESSKVEIHFLLTGKAKTLEGLTIAQGSLTTGFEIGHGAILVKHEDDCFLFDTGLGRAIDAQFDADMPYWIRPMMAYEKGEAAVDQLQNSKDLPKPKRIFLSHAHWDHASGVVDFPDLEIWLPKEELEYLKSAKPPEVLPSQVKSEDIKWTPYSLKDKSYAGFSRSLDLYGDGTVVLVGLSGHSPGSVGLFVNSKDGGRRFFVGDAVWNMKSITELKRKFWIASKIVDGDSDATDQIIAKLHGLLKANPELKIIPAHDLSVWK